MSEPTIPISIVKEILSSFFKECYPELLKPGTGRGLAAFSPYELLCEIISRPDAWEEFKSRNKVED